MPTIAGSFWEFADDAGARRLVEPSTNGEDGTTAGFSKPLKEDVVAAAIPRRIICQRDKIRGR